MSKRRSESNPMNKYNKKGNAFDFPESLYCENANGCPSWRMVANEFAHVEPGSIGFNGHQAVFHGYRPGQRYTHRNGQTDKCTIKLSSLPTGTQICTVAYDKPKLHFIPEPENVCTVDRQVATDFDVMYPVLDKIILTEDNSADVDKGKVKVKAGKSGKLAKRKKVKGK